MDRNEVERRQRAKSSEAQIQRILEQDYALAPRVAQAVLEEVQDYLKVGEARQENGQIVVNLVRHDSGHGQALSETETVCVHWTVDAGKADKEVGVKEGLAALRRHRIVRLLDEAVDQGGIATQEDLAAALNITVRTIKRDFAYLHKAGHFLPSRGYRQGIGRGQSHKVQIIEQWLSGATYDQIMERTRHSAHAIQRYIQTFARIVELHQQQMSPEQIGFITQIGHTLVGRYLALYHAIDKPEQRERLQAQLARMASGRPLAKKKGVA